MEHLGEQRGQHSTLDPGDNDRRRSQSRKAAAALRNADGDGRCDTFGQQRIQQGGLRLKQAAEHLYQ